MSIEIENLNFSVNDKALLSDVNLSLNSSEFTALIGPNGAGKSTLLGRITNSLKDYTGEVRVNGNLINSYTPVELSQLRAVMTQSYELPFDFTVHEVIEMGTFPYEESLNLSLRQNITREVMEFLDISSFSNRNFLSLSGGEKQRVQLGRVLAQLWHHQESDASCSPRFLIMDEPTSSLDIFHQYNIMSLCKELTKRNIGILAVIHDLALAASFADKVVLIDHGKIVAEGDPESIFNQDYLSQVYKINAHLFSPQTNAYPAMIVNKF